MARKLDDMVEQPAEETSTALVAQDDTAPVGKVFQFGQAISFDSEDIVYPKLRLAQGLTAEVSSGDARPGQFVLTGYDAQSRVTFVPLGVGKSRLLSEGRGDDFHVLCSSSDAKVGHGVPGGPCAECPMSRPQPKPGDPSKKVVPCTLSYNFVGYAVEFESLVEISFKRTQMGVAKQINTFILQRGAGKFAVELSSTQQKSGGNTFYVPLAKVVPVDSEVLDIAGSMLPDGMVEEYDPDLEAAS